MQHLQSRAQELRAEAAALEARLRELQVEIENQRQRVEIARRLLESYREMNSFWDWLFGASVDQKTLDRRKADASDTQAAATRAIEGLAGEVTAISSGRESVLTELSRTEAEINRLEQHASPLVQYLRRAWRTYRWPLAIALLAYFFGPTLWSLAAYYGLAPLVSRSSPIRFSARGMPDVTVGPSRVSESVTLAPGETIFVREKFLQASDESLRRRTRFVLDWRIPFTSAATGLIELVELSNDQTGDSAAVTVSTQDDTTIELGSVGLPDGSAMILRPSFLAAVILPSGSRLRIRRHWRLFHVQSWVTLQFRFFEFRGPCRLVVAGSRGIRAECLDRGIGVRPRGRRTNQDSTIGFTPDLAYRSVRAETFWAYYRKRNPLFDDLFQGSGTFLCQEVPADAPGAGARRFWESFWNGLLKVFGL